MKRKKRRESPTASTPVTDWEQVERDLHGLQNLNEMQRALIGNLEKVVRRMRRQQSLRRKK